MMAHKVMLGAASLVAGFSMPEDSVHDLVVPQSTQNQILEDHDRGFWNAWKGLSEELHLEKHAEFFDNAEKFLQEDLAKMGVTEEDQVKCFLSEAVTAARNACLLLCDVKATALSETDTHSKAAAPMTLATPFAAAGHFLEEAYKRIIQGPTKFSEKAAAGNEQRMTNVLPLLSKTCNSFTGISGQCRLATSKSFEAEKTFIYANEYPRTGICRSDLVRPQIVEYCEKVRNTATEIRQAYMSFTLGGINQIVADVQATRGKAKGANLLAAAPLPDVNEDLRKADL